MDSAALDWPTVLAYLTAASSIYFLVSLLTALVHGEANTRLRAWGLGVSLVLLMLTSLFRSFPGQTPAGGEPLRRLPRLPDIGSHEDVGDRWPERWESRLAGAVQDKKPGG
jgi:hypothetical protein